MSVDLQCIHTRSQKVFLKKFYTLLAVQNHFDFLFHFPDSRGTEKRVEVVKLGQSLRLNCHPSTNGTPKKWKPHSKWKKSNFRYTKWYKNGQRLMPSGLSKNMSIKNKRLVQYLTKDYRAMSFRYPSFPPSRSCKRSQPKLTVNLTVHLFTQREREKKGGRGTKFLFP